MVALARLRHRGGTRRLMEHILLYDTTLRDGMQREGMSLSVGEQ
jgi:hypothetical protein